MINAPPFTPLEQRFAKASEELATATDALDAAELEWLELEEKREQLEG